MSEFQSQVLKFSSSLLTILSQSKVEVISLSEKRVTETLRVECKITEPKHFGVHVLQKCVSRGLDFNFKLDKIEIVDKDDHFNIQFSTGQYDKPDNRLNTRYTVQELIDLLSQLDPDSVLVFNDDQVEKVAYLTGDLYLQECVSKIDMFKYHGIKDTDFNYSPSTRHVEIYLDKN